MNELVRQLIHEVGEVAEEMGEDWRLDHPELMDAYFAIQQEEIDASIK